MCLVNLKRLNKAATKTGYNCARKVANQRNWNCKPSFFNFCGGKINGTYIKNGVTAAHNNTCAFAHITVDAILCKDITQKHISRVGTERTDESQLTNLNWNAQKAKNWRQKIAQNCTQTAVAKKFHGNKHCNDKRHQTCHKRQRPFCPSHKTGIRIHTLDERVKHNPTNHNRNKQISHFVFSFCKWL